MPIATKTVAIQHISKRIIKLSVDGSIAASVLQVVVNAPNTMPTGICSRFLHSKRRRISSICRMTRMTWKMTVATPISMPQTQVMVYGMELTGDTPRLDLTDSAMPIVMTKKPPK